MTDRPGRERCTGCEALTLYPWHDHCPDCGALRKMACPEIKSDAQETERDWLRRHGWSVNTRNRRIANRAVETVRTHRSAARRKAKQVV